MRCSLLLLSAVLLSPSVSEAQRNFSSEQLKSGKKFKELFKDLVSPARLFTVRIKIDDKNAALGTIVSPEGHILTKASELSGKPICHLSDGREFEAELVGLHQEFDVALLKIKAGKLTVADWTTTSPVLGHWVVSTDIEQLPVAVGNISVKPRKIAPTRGVLGISISDHDSGAEITRIYPRSGAEKAGLKTGDIITTLDGEDVGKSTDLTNRVKKLSPGDRVLVGVLRGEKEFDVLVRLGDVPVTSLNRGAFQNRLGGRLSVRRGGFPLVVQHDTILKPEDCGGPLLNLKGEVIGINIARSGRTESFAIMAKELLPVLSDLRSGKLAPPKSTKFWLESPPPPEKPEN